MRSFTSCFWNCNRTNIHRHDCKPRNFARNLALFHSNSINPGQTATLKVGGERAHKTAQFTYWPCHDRIRTEIFNWRERCGNHIFGTTVRFQPGQKPMVLCPAWLTNLPRHSASGFWPGLEPNRQFFAVQTQTAGRLPGPVANTTLLHTLFNNSTHPNDPGLG